MKRKKLLARSLGLGLCVSLLTTATLQPQAPRTPGAAADITAPDGQVATLLVNGVVTRFDGQ